MRLAARSAHLEDLAQLGHHERLDVAHVEALLAVGVHAAEERGGLERATIHGDTRLLAAEHLTETSDKFLLIDEAIPVRIHQIEEAVEGLFEQVVALLREVRVLGDLRELALEEVLKLGLAKIAVKLDVADEELRDVLECVTVAEAEDLLQVLIAALGRLAEPTVALGLAHVAASVIEIHRVFVTAAALTLHRVANTIL